MVWTFHNDNITLHTNKTFYSKLSFMFTFKNSSSNCFTVILHNQLLIHLIAYSYNQNRANGKQPQKTNHGEKQIKKERRT
jgi:hypothetical protein